MSATSWGKGRPRPRGRVGTSSRSLAELGVEQEDEGDEHPGGEIGEGDDRRHRGPQKPGDAAGREVAEALDGGEEAEGGTASVGWGGGGDGRVLGGLDATDGDASGDEGRDEAMTASGPAASPT